METSKPYYFRIQQSPIISNGVEIVAGADLTLISGGIVLISSCFLLGSKTIEWAKAAIVFFRTTMPNTSKNTEIDEFIEKMLDTAAKYMPNMTVETSEILKNNLKCQEKAKVAEYAGKMMVSTPEAVLETIRKIIEQGN